MKKILVGVDEAGRGPLAGPVSVGIVSVPVGFNIKKAFPGINDSKQLTEKKREELYEIAVELKKAGTINFCVRFGSHTMIDDIGITKVVRKGIFSGVRSLAPKPKGVHVLLDGLLSAPEEYSQQTIIRGDATEPIISLASIVAKVSRDRLMCRLGKQYPEYGFEIHKGYGTKRHRDIIARVGISEVHRRTYCHF
ncbi:ribonuclease HII [Patescibacteria group bacterium]|nr:ribonuclease HII [Patescibacteria group bacterium]